MHLHLVLLVVVSFPTIRANAVSSSFTKALTSLARSGSSQIAAHAHSLAIQTSAIVVASIFVLASFGCATASLWILTAPKLGDAGAALVSSGFLLLIGMLIIVISQWIVRKKRREMAIPQLPILPFSEANKLFQKNKGAALLVALLAGILMAKQRNKR